jgi:predicted nucleotidyltransferase
MSPVIEAHRAELTAACREFQVDRLEAFGSVVRTDFDPARSDVDLIVRFHQPGEKGYADRYLGLSERLEQILGRRVDLMTERSIRNPIFRRSIEPERVVIDGS